MGPTDTEVALVGHEVAVGDARLAVRRRLGRCVMTTRPQPGGIERDLDVLRTINRERSGYLAVGAVVMKPGRMAVGDAITDVTPEQVGQLDRAIATPRAP